ncbi:MAG: YihY/virulence factor BrkB family protein [Patescibacteria group bacterium]|nr:YihY/virulence factor BrkB family protein [Patescibacteria group bacterium]
MKRPVAWMETLARQLWLAAAHWRAHDGNLRAAATAYYAVLSILPLLLVLVSLLGIVFRFSPEAQGAQTELLGIVAERTSPGIAQWLDGILSQVRNKASLSGPLGLAALLLAAIGVFTQIEKAFDAIWGVKPPESRGIRGAILFAVWRRVRALIMLIALGLVVILMAALGLALAMVQPWLPELPGSRWTGPFVQLPCGLLVDWLLFTPLYKLAPKRRVRWQDAARGALLAGVLWELARQALSFGLLASRYGAYGVIGAVIVFMLWGYAGAAIIFFGAEYVHVLGGDAEDVNGYPAVTFRGSWYDNAR